MHRSAFDKLALAVFFAVATPAGAQLAISSNDAKMTLVNGVATAIDKPGPDTVALIDLSGTPKLVAEIDVPGSFMGPPLNVAISPDGRLALVSSAFKLDPRTRRASSPTTASR